MNKCYLLMPALCLAVACSSETTESGQVSTEVIWADMKVTSDGDQARVVAELNVDGALGNNLKLTAGDKLTVTANGQTRELKEDHDFFDIDYQAYLPFTTTNTSFSIQLTRESKNQTLVSTVQLPAAFRIYAPQQGQKFRLDDSMYIAWQGLGGDKLIDINYSARCTRKSDGNTFTQSATVNTSDDGSYELVLNSLNAFKDADINLTKPCTLTIYLSRINTGIIDSKYKAGSSIRAVQQRTIEDLKVFLN